MDFYQGVEIMSRKQHFAFQQLAAKVEENRAMNKILDETVELGWLEEVPGKPGNYRVTQAGEEHLKSMLKTNQPTSKAAHD